MPVTFSQFDEYKLSTEFVEGCWRHTISCDSGVRTERWSRDKVLGKGGYGTVWLEREEKGALRAVKQISETKKLLNSRELLALIKLQAVNIPPLTS